MFVSSKTLQPLFVFCWRFISVPQSACEEKQCWTPFYYLDDPRGDNGCDCEDFPTLISAFPEICASPTAIDFWEVCDESCLDQKQNVHLSLSKSLQCRTEDQKSWTNGSFDKHEECADYEIRYCCRNEDRPNKWTLSFWFRSHIPPQYFKRCCRAHLSVRKAK